MSDPAPEGNGDSDLTAWSSFAPVLLGVLIDALDFVTLGPIGIAWGWLIGGGATLIAAMIIRVPAKQAVVWSILVALYCSFPGTAFIPIATAVSLIIKLMRTIYNPKPPS